MKTQLTILVIIALAGIAYAQLSRCSCSDLKVKAECDLHIGACKWADSACSEVACADRGAGLLTCLGSQGVEGTNLCVAFKGKCQAVAAKCADLTSTTALTAMDCIVSMEGQCELDTSDNLKCKKLPDVPAACKDRTDPDKCEDECYYHDSKCNDMPKDCSGAVQPACPGHAGCIWKDSKCQATTCALQLSTECRPFLKSDGTAQFCEVVNGACANGDFSSLKVETCHTLTMFSYHFDGSCVACGSSSSSTLVSALIIMVLAAMI